MDGVNVITIEREQFTRNLNVSSYNQTKNFQTSIIIPHEVSTVATLHGIKFRKFNRDQTVREMFLIKQTWH